ncbi:RNA pseudouridine synthase [Pontibacter liquoris]|uniref:RNA pseudouridine synthase n=1 Tax=Pontibacter liquoris TaxID=2905677 RepID=UPI001FA6F492|nr:RNA pseudouridine synthase [Pontibacter liquoris]
MTVLTSSLKYFVVQQMRVSNKEAIQAILAGKVLVNGEIGRLHQVLQPEDRVSVADKIIKEPTAFIYLAYYKPRGIESTLNPQIADNLLHALNLAERVYPVGRLDKESEGLMLLTNNGKIFDLISHPERHQEKEYLVTVDKPLTEEAIARLAAGIVIMGQRTRPAVVAQVDATSFKIILTQGLNRQIRRMCYKLGYQVERLVRLRMASLELGDLKAGEWRPLNENEIRAINQLQAL